jgi:hypothetical protein
MFGKKKPAPLPYTIQALTTEYLIEGQAEGNGQLYLPHNTEEWAPIHLTSVQIKATGLPDSPPRTAAQLHLQGNAIVTLIPRKDVKELDQYDSWKIYKHRRKGLFFVGPYLVLGTMMFLDDDLFDNALPMTDVIITHRHPNAPLGELRAPFILVNTLWLSGYEPM